MRSNADVDAAPRHEEDRAKDGRGNDCPRGFREAAWRGAYYGPHDDDMRDDAHENGGPEQQLGKEGGHGQSEERGPLRIRES